MRLDIERIREDNAAKRDVTRKGGLIIHMGGNAFYEENEWDGWTGPLPQEEIARRRLLAAKYELTEKQKLNVDQEIRRLKETQNLSEVPINVRQGLFGNCYSTLAVFEAFLDGILRVLQDGRKEKCVSWSFVWW